VFRESIPAFRFKPPTVSLHVGIACHADRHDDDEALAVFWSAARARP
jgi:hypothetical protein